MADVADAIFSALRRMDEEATTIRDGWPTGLYWYGPHVRPELKKPQTEPEWTKRLAKLLPGMGFGADAEVRYPNLPASRRYRCDLVVTLQSHDRLWLEIKGAWKTWWVEQKGEALYRSYLFHPLIPGLVEKSHTAALDLQKVSTVKPPEAQHIGLLLIGFDSTDVPMSGDVAEFTELAGIDRLPWSGREDAWDDPRRTGCSTRCWLWRRPV